MSLPEVIELQGSLDLDTSARVHHLPCRVSHDGAAKVNTYFVPADVADERGARRDAWTG